MKNIALVAAGGHTLKKDLEKAKIIADRFGFKFTTFVGVNDFGAEWPVELDYFATLHPEKLPMWKEKRKALGLNTNCTFVTRHHSTVEIRDGGLTTFQKDKDWGGSSGLFGVQVAATIANADKIILAGIPMDNGSHYNSEKPWQHFEFYRRGWTMRKDFFAPLTRSLSGWTRDLLGAPTAEWISA